MKLKLFFLPLILFFMVMGYIFAFFYTELALQEFNGFNIKIRDMRGQKTFNLPVQQTYLLKIWGDDIIEKAYLNGLPLIHTIYRRRTTLKEFYYLLPAGTTKTGENTLTAGPGMRYSFVVRNNIVTADFGVIAFKNSQIKKIMAAPGLFVSFMLFFSAIGLFSCYVFSSLFSLPFNKVFIAQAASFLPCILFFCFLRQINNLLPINLYFLKNSYFGICAFLILIFQLPAMFFLILRESRVHTGLVTDVKGYTKQLIGHRAGVIADVKRYTKQLIGHRAVKWFLASEFSDKCVILFIALLFLCALLISFKLEFIASFFGNMAYLALTTAVIIKLCKSTHSSS
ncbi:MAG: hypothetical protein HZB36_05545 [Candidatus Omnitrophica bacterium]|nr:hypothetical protein [Candidatus Omnitrophota bacterium]